MRKAVNRMTYTINPFISYLNSLHNEQASNQNAIAEMQIQDQHFAKTQVKHPLTLFLKKKMEAGEFVVLTGHAGDGKTTLLTQVLEALDRKPEILLEEDTVDCGFSLHYVKDFSELTHEKQDSVLKTCFAASEATLLIANTGPLLNAMQRLVPDDPQLENTLLDAMDQPAGQSVDIAGFGTVFFLNIARVDNTSFIREYLQNIIQDELWQTCDSCQKKGICPMYMNRCLVKEHFARVASFIERVYIWLQEYDNRATIRQITAHITYAMTGGVSCESVWEDGQRIWRYLYLFSNLLWGSQGAKEDIAAQQIRGIRLLNAAGFDQKPTSIDYDLFIKHDVYRYFPPQFQGMLKEVEKLTRPISDDKKQRVLKRAYLLFGINTPAEDRVIQQQIFSPWFETYLDGRNNGTKPSNKIRKAICQAINTLFVGESYEDISNIYLTLRRNNEQTSNVQLLNGQISEEQIRLKFEKCPTSVPDKQQYQLMLFADEKVKFRVGLPLLNYFYEIHQGVIITDIDPMLSNGIDSLKAQLLSAFKKHNDENEIAILFLQGSHWKRRKLIVTDNSIDHE